VRHYHDVLPSVSKLRCHRLDVGCVFSHAGRWAFEVASYGREVDTDGLVAMGGKQVDHGDIEAGWREGARNDDDDWFGGGGR
jgi:hypothetical protein